METTINTKEYKIDATGRKLGRLASEIAVILMGKDSPDFVKNKVADVRVLVSNVSKLDMSSKKKEVPRYKTYSGYPGGLKISTANQVIKKHGYGEILKKAVKGMLPKNKLQSVVLKNLEISE